MICNVFEIRQLRLFCMGRARREQLPAPIPVFAFQKFLTGEVISLKKL